MASSQDIVFHFKGIDDGLSTTADAVADCAEQIANSLRALSVRIRQIQRRTDDPPADKASTG